MKEQVEKVLADVFTRHSDRRVDLFKVQVESADASNGVRLSGRVLTPESLEETRAGIAAALPGVGVDVLGVRVLRARPGAMYTVATTVTDLHVEPSFLSEMLLQVVNGTGLEVLEEHTDGKWVFVRMGDGYLGWAHKPYLSEGGPVGGETHIIVGHAAVVCEEPQKRRMTQLLMGTRVRVLEEGRDWSRVAAAGSILREGWVPAIGLKALAELPVKRRPDAGQGVVYFARTMVGTYYLWGGNTPWGIDCSGLAQLTHKLCGYTLPRDADMQFKAGRPVEGPFEKGDLLFFHSETRKEKITHVGISVGGWDMIHSSRSRNGVYEENVQENENLRKTFAGARTFLPR